MSWFKKSSQKRETNNPVMMELSRLMTTNRQFLVLSMVVVVAFVIFTSFRGQQTLLPLLEETQFSIVDLSGVTHSFSYADAELIELRDDFQSFDRGEKLSGTETRNCYSGTYQNDEFGEYQLHAMANLNAYIVVHLPQEVLVLSYESDETTRMLYQSFTEDSGYQP